jgi:hypothetical protein
LFFDKCAKNIHLEREHLFKGGKTGRHVQSSEIKLFPLTTYKINSEWIKDLIIRPETIKVLEGNAGRKIHNTRLSNLFLDMIPKAQATEAKIDKQLHQMK